MLENSIHTVINSLAVLTGIPITAAEKMLDGKSEMPEYIQMVNAGIPIELLRRRPDIVQAEMELAQYAAEIGIAKKMFCQPYQSTEVSEAVPTVWATL